jgi:manganese/zinc/iron transport system permease protein
MIIFFIFVISFLITALYTILGPCITLIKSSFFIDAVGHTIVFGIAAGFLLVHSLHSPFILFAAIMSAFLMNFFSAFLKKKNMIPYDASLGIAFSTFFSLGILLISLYGKNIHLDLDMILLGNIEYALYDTFSIGSYFVPKIIFFLSGAMLFFSLFMYVFKNQLLLLFFDREFAYTKGVYTRLIQYIFLSATSIIIVITFNVIGSLLLLGLCFAPFAFSWHRSYSFYDFLKSAFIKSISVALMSVIFSLYANISIGAAISFFVTTASLINFFICL